MSDQVLPADWKLDYDVAAKQWCYIHKITSRKQYTFPRDGDELNLGSEPAPLHPVEDAPRHAEDQSLEVNMASLNVSGHETVGRRDSNAAAFRQPTPRSGTLQPSEDGAWRFVEFGSVNTTPQLNGGGDSMRKQALGPRSSDTAVSTLETNQGLRMVGWDGGGSAHGREQTSPTPTLAFSTGQQGLAEMSGSLPGQSMAVTPASTTNPASVQQQLIPPQTPLTPAPSQPESTYKITPSQQQHQSYGNVLSSPPTPSPSVYSVSSVGYDPHTPQRQDSMVSAPGYQNSPQEHSPPAQGHSPPAQGYGATPQQVQQQLPPQRQYSAPLQGFYSPQQPYPQPPQQQQQHRQYPPSVLPGPSFPPAGNSYHPPQSTPAPAHSHGSSIHKSRFDSLFPKSKSALPPSTSRRPQMMRPPIQYQQAMRPAEIQTMGNITINHYSVTPSGAPAPPQPQWYPPPTQPLQYQQQYPVYQPPATPQPAPPMGHPGTVPSPPQYPQPQPMHPPPATIPSPHQQVYPPPGGLQPQHQFGAPQ